MIRFKRLTIALLALLSVSATAWADDTNPVVTIAQDETTKQYEASFTMPQYDVTATYTIKRDMSVDVNAEIAGSIRIQQQGGTFSPVDANAIWPVVTDDLDTENPVGMTKDTHYTLTLQKQSETNEEEWTDVTTYSVGTFRYKIEGTGNYSGVVYTGTFRLFQGYEVTVPAGEYITYYKDEALYVEDTDAKLYTITAVNGDKATATELTVAAASTPLLVKNNAETEKTILLIPTTNEADNVTAATEFKGTLDAAQIAASTSTQNNYAFNGKEFVWVKNAIDIAANKAWLEVNTPSNARAISIVFGDTTGINEALRVKSEESADGDWYDLDGRKLQAAPKRKGVYIHNGRKEVVK